MNDVYKAKTHEKSFIYPFIQPDFVTIEGNREQPGREFPIKDLLTCIDHPKVNSTLPQLLFCYYQKKLH